MKAIILMAIFLTNSLSACPICGIEMDAMKAKLDYGFEIGAITEGERNAYENGFIEAVNIMTKNHPKGEN